MTKKDLLLALLRQSSAYVQLDGRRDGVQLPEWLKTESSVVLQIGYDMAVPILDLAIDDDGITATLSFRRAPYRCVVPWSAVYTIADHEGHRALFPDDIPSDLLAGTPAPAPAPGGLRAVPDAAEPPPPDASAPPEAATRKPRPSYLKLVK